MTAIRTPFNELQKALFQRLQGDLSVLVIDELKENQTYPFVEIGEYDVREDDSKGVKVFVVSSIVHVYSDDPGTKQINQIIAEVVGSVTRDALVLENNFSVYDVEFLRGQIRKEFNEKRDLYERHAALTVEFFISDDTTED